MTKGVFRLLTFFFSTACLAAFVWFGLTVDLGDRTLFGHIRAIGSSEEAQDLGKGIKSKVDDFVGIEAAKRAAEEAARKKLAGKSGDDDGDGDGESARGDDDRAGAEGKRAKPAARKTGPPQDEHSAGDREELRKLAGAKPPGPAPKGQGRATPLSSRPPAPVQK